MGSPGFLGLSSRSVVGDIAEYTDQPRPVVVENAVSAHDLVMADLNRFFSSMAGRQDAVDFMQERKDFGLTKYGVVLHADNGRNYPKDIADEAGDLVAYLRVFLERHPEIGDIYWDQYISVLHFFVKFCGDRFELEKLDRS